MIASRPVAIFYENVLDLKILKIIFSNRCNLNEIIENQSATPSLYSGH